MGTARRRPRCVTCCTRSGNRDYDGSHTSRREHRIGFPCAGTWRVRFNSDWGGYSDAFANHPSHDLDTVPEARDGFPCQGTVSVGAYSVLILSR